MSDNGKSTNATDLVPMQEVAADDPEKLIQSLLPFAQDNKKSLYISYRASGFTVREAVKLVGIHEKTLHRWREGDPVFLKHENSIAEYRQTLGVEYAHLEFLRNYRLILEKDFNILIKSMREPTKMSQLDNQYLLKARSHYTPQQLEVLRGMIGAKTGSKEFDFTKFVLTMQRVKEEVTVAVSREED